MTRGGTAIGKPVPINTIARLLIGKRERECELMAWKSEGSISWRFPLWHNRMLKLQLVRRIPVFTSVDCSIIDCDGS